jgi:hypothetical protein
MITFIIPFCSIDETTHLNIPNTWKDNNWFTMVSTTLKIIKNINEHHMDREIILVDNSHNWPNIGIPRVRVIPGWQAYNKENLIHDSKFKAHNDIIDVHQLDWQNDTMWASLGFHKAIQEAKGDYIILQHNDFFYMDTKAIPNMIEDLENDNLEYISVDSKKVSLLTYMINQELFDKYIDVKKFSPQFGGMLETKMIGLSDAYFFLCRKKFFDNYDVDWKYGDSNHGATIYCLENKLNYLHLGPYYDNPSYQTQDQKNGYNTYYYAGKPFGGHLKGGFSENKLADSTYAKLFHKGVNEYS